MENKNIKKTLITLAIAELLSTAACYAADVLSGDVLKNTGMGGANLNNVNGATVKTDYNNATITNTTKNSVLEWNTLNTGKDQSLKYVFPATIGSGQTALNKVIGNGMSQFAGKLTTSGDGHVIISNPNGMLLLNGSYTQANELTLTTKNVVFDTNGNFALKDNGNKNSITVGQGVGNAAVVRVAKNLNIVAPIINVNGAELVSGSDDKSVLGGDIRLITSDGVNFYVDTNKFNANQGIKNINNTNNLTIKNANIAVKNKANGKIYLTTKGNLNIENTDLSGSNSEMYIGNDLNLRNSKLANAKLTTVGNATIGQGTDFKNSSIYAVKDIMTDNAAISGSILTSERNIKISNNSVIDATKFYVKKGNADIVNSKIQNGSIIKAGVLNLQNSTMENSTAETSYVANLINASTIRNSKIIAGDNVKAENLRAYDSEILSNLKISVNNGSELNSVHLYAGSDISIEGSRVLNNSSLAADRDLLIKNTSVEGNAAIYAGNLAQIMSSSVRNADITGNSLSLYNARLSDSSVDLKNNLTITQGSELSNVNAINHGELNIGNNSRVNNSILIAQVGANLDNAYLISTDLMTNGSVFAKNSTFENNSSLVSNSGDIYISDSNINNRTDVKTQNEMKIENSNVNSSKLSANKITFKHSNASDSELTAKDVINVNTNSGLRNNSKLSAGGFINIYSTEVQNSKLKANDLNLLDKTNMQGGDISVNNNIVVQNSNVRDTNIYAGNIFEALDKSELTNIYSLYAGNLINVNSSKLSNSNLLSNIIKMNTGRLENSTATAQSEFIIFDASDLNNCRSILSNGTMDIYASNFNNSDVSSVGDMNVSGTNTLTNSRLFTNQKLFAEGLIADNNSFVGAEDTAKINKARFNNSTVYAKNYLTLKSNNINNSYVSSNDIEIGKSDVKNSRFSAKRHLSFYDYSTADNIMADYFQSISVTTDSKITNSNLRLGYLLLDGVVAENVNADAKYDLKYFNSELKGDYITATAKQNILFGNISNNSNITMNGGSIIINNSNLGNANITSTLKGLSMASSEADSLTVSGQGNVLIYDTIVNSDLKIMNNDGVALVGDYVGGNTTVENVANVYVKSSDSESSSELFDELTANAYPTTSYDSWKYSDDDFVSKTSDSNKNSVFMGNLNINNAKNTEIVDTVVVGDVTVNNVSENSEIINTYIGGNITENNINGDKSWFKVYTNKTTGGNNGNNGNHYGWENGNNGNNGNHYGWENGNNGNHYGWKKSHGHGYGHDYDKIGWGYPPRDDHFHGEMTPPPYWEWNRPDEGFHGPHGFDRNFLAYWNNFMFGHF